MLYVIRNKNLNWIGDILGNTQQHILLNGIQMMFGSSLPPVVCRRSHVLFTLFVFVCVYSGVQHLMILNVLCFCFVFIRLVMILASPKGLL